MASSNFNLPPDHAVTNFRAYLSHEAGHAQNYISGDRWREKELDPDSKGKWLYAVKATRAWSVVPEDWKRVEDIFPEAYSSAHPEFIGASGVKVSADEAEKLLQLDVQEVQVYGRTEAANPTIQTLGSALSPSRAIPPPSEPYTVGETDGPKYLYVLQLQGDIAAYLGCSPNEVEDKSIIKVGFSKSPLARRNQIQSAYPEGSFKWSVLFPSPMPDHPPYDKPTVAKYRKNASLPDSPSPISRAKRSRSSFGNSAGMFVILPQRVNHKSNLRGIPLIQTLLETL